MPEVNDWMAESGAPAHPQDDWIKPPADTALERAHDKIGARDPFDVSPGSAGSRVVEAVKRGTKEGFGSEQLGLSPQSEAELSKLGIFHEPGKGYVGPAGTVQLLNEAILRPSAAGADAFFRALSAGVTGVSAGVGQAAQEFGENPAMAGRLTRDVQAGQDIALMSHIPERGLMEAGRTAGAPAMEPVRSTPQQIEDFLGQVRGRASRAEIDEFLRQRAEREARAQAASTPRLPPPDAEPTAPAAAPRPNAPAPETPPAAGARPLDEAFPSFEEPGRAPPAPVDDWIAPQETPSDRQGGQQVLGQVGERQEPGNLQQPSGGGAPAQTGRILQAPQGAPAAENAPRPNVGQAKLEELLADPRKADEIRSDRAAEAGVSDAVASHGAAMAGKDTAAPPAVIALPPPAAAAETAQTPTLSLEELLADPRSADEIRRAQQEAQNAPLPPPEPSPPTPGTPDNPVALSGPQHVHQGAEITATPTPAQAEAGNYRKRHVTWNGLDIAIETEAGQQRTGIGPDGKPWSVTLTTPYGYLKGTQGRDGDQVDVYLGPHPQSPHVYIVDQVDHQTGAFDEHKAMIGFPDEASARAAYAQAHSDGHGPARLGALRALTVPEFKHWLTTDLRTPLTYSDPVRALEGLAKQHGLNATPAEIEAAARAAKVNNTDPLEELVTAIEHSAIVEEGDSPDSIQHGEADAVEPANANVARAEPAPTGEQEGRPGAQEAEQAPPRVEPGEAQRDQAVEPGAAAEHWWDHELTTAGRSFFLKQIGIQKPPRVKWRFLEIHERAKLLTQKPPSEPTSAAPTPQVEPEWGYVLPSFVTAEHVKKPEAPSEALPEPAEPKLRSPKAHWDTADFIKLAKEIPSMDEAKRAQTRENVERAIARMEEDGRKIAEHCIETGARFSIR